MDILIDILIWVVPGLLAAAVVLYGTKINQGHVTLGELVGLTLALGACGWMSAVGVVLVFIAVGLHMLAEFVSVKIDWNKKVF